jgi:hypothetical protein
MGGLMLLQKLIAPCQRHSSFSALLLGVLPFLGQKGCEVPKTQPSALQ